jgi:hypothetical protein
LAFYFEFYVADFHLDLDGWPLRVLCQVGTCCLLYCARCTCTIFKYFTNMMLNIGESW